MSTSAKAADLLEHFRSMEARLESEPETVRAEIVRGLYLMSPRPRPRHAHVEGRLYSALDQALGRSGGAGEAPDWLFLIEPEIRSERAFSRLIPDIAGWRRSMAGWPDPDVTPISLVPEWVAEILSPGTADFDRGEKSDAYGAMGVGWIWLVDVDAASVETFSNARGRMVRHATFALGQEISGEPFGALRLPVQAILDYGR